MPIYSNQPVNHARSSYLQLLAAEQAGQASDVREYRDFYEGDQGAMLTVRLAEFLNVTTNTEFAVNLMPLVIDSLVERLAVKGFSTGDDAVDAVLWKWWQDNRMDAVQIQTMTAAARDGKSYIIVEWDSDAGRPAFHFNEAWDGDEGVKVHWSGKPGSRILFASKRWREDFDEDGKLVTRRRLNLYFEDRVEKYVAAGATGSLSEAGWMPLADEDGVWPTPWTNPRTGKGLGIAVVPFLNKNTGTSEIKVAIPMQKALNKTVLDILAAADVEGFGIFTKTGGMFVTTPVIAPGSFWQDTDPAAAFGKIDAGSITTVLEAYWTFCKTVAILTRRPLSLFMGYASGESGESLKERESGLVAQAKQACVNFGNAWEDVMKLALFLSDAFGTDTDSLSTEMVITSKWADVEVRNEAEQRGITRADFTAKLIDQEYAWQEMGISEENQTAMMRRMRAAEARRVAVALRIAEGQGTGDGQDAEDKGDADDEDDGQQGAQPDGK